MPMGARVLRSRMRIVPIDLARLAIERPWLQRASVDTNDRHHLGIIARRKNFVGVLDVTIAQRGLDHGNASLSQELDHPLTGNSVEKCSVRRSGKHYPVLRDKNVGSGELRHIAEKVEHDTISITARIRPKQRARI